MEVKLLKATRAHRNARNGLITIQYRVSSYVHTELLTHRRASRNASSARAQQTKDHVALGYYTPPVFYKSGKGMQASDEPIKYQTLARLIWHTSYALDVLAAKLLEKLDVCKEQRNRVIAPYKYIKGIVTMTEHGWDYFLSLRNTQHADKAMQHFALLVKARIDELNHKGLWDYSDIHIPFDGREDNLDERVKTAAAKIARVSYAKEAGKNDLRLADRLIRDRHMSPFDHICFFRLKPELSAVFCSSHDAYIEGLALPYAARDRWMYGYGWEPARYQYEKNS